MTSGWKYFGVLAMATAVILALVFIKYNPQITNLVDSSPLVTEERTVSGYDKISFSGVGEVELLQTGSYGMQITADQNIMSDIYTRVENKTLYVEYKWDWQKNSLKNQRPIKIQIQISNLQQIDLLGAGQILSSSIRSPYLAITVSGASMVDLNLDTDTLIAQINGAGQITLTGSATSQDIKITGAGKYLSQNLKSQSADIDISGLGVAEIDATKALNITISGGGKVYYSGSPKLTQNISGLGNIEKIK